MIIINNKASVLQPMKAFTFVEDEKMEPAPERREESLVSTVFSVPLPSGHHYSLQRPLLPCP